MKINVFLEPLWMMKEQIVVISMLIAQEFSDKILEEYGSYCFQKANMSFSLKQKSIFRPQSS